MTEPARKGRRWWRITKRVVLSLFIIAVLLIFGVFPYWLAGIVSHASTRPVDRKMTETPATYGAEFKDVHFQAMDGVDLSGWLLPSRGKRVTIVYSHGLFRSRRELLERAVDLWKLGYGALLYDSRNHGESGPAKVTLGYAERLDAEGAVRFLRDIEKTPDRIVLFGISMGAAAALLAAAETPDVAAVISDSSFLTFEDTTTHHVRLFLRLPAFPMANELIFLIERRAGFDGAKLDALSAVQHLGEKPVMFIAAARDRRMPPEIARRLYENSASSRSDLLVIDGPGAEVHAHGYQANPGVYITRVAAFLASAVGN